MDVSSTLPQVSAAALMPTMYPSVMAALRRSATPTAGSLARAVLATSASGREGASDGGGDTSADMAGDGLHVDDEAGHEGGQG